LPESALKTLAGGALDVFATGDDVWEMRIQLQLLVARMNTTKTAIPFSAAGWVYLLSAFRANHPRSQRP
jgi:hypothetical protein